MTFRRSRPRGSFALRTMAAGVGLVVALVLLASVALVASHRQQRLDEIATSAHDQAIVTHNLVDSVSIAEEQATVGSLAADPALTRLLAAGGAATQLADLLSTARPQEGITLYLVGRDGATLATLPASAPGWSAGTVSTVTAALAGRTATAPSSSTPGAVLAEIAAVPVRSGGSTVGAVVAVMPLEAQLQRFVPVVGFPVVLISGDRVAHASILGGGTASSADLSAAVGDRLVGAPAEIGVSARIAGEQDVVDLVALDSSGAGYVGVVVPSPGFFATEGTTLLTVAMLALLAATLTSLAVLIVVDRSVRRPVADLDRGVARIVAEDYGTEIPIRSDDELGRLAAAFNEMARRIGEEMAQTRSALVHLGWVSEALTTSGGGESGTPGAIVRAAAAIAGPDSSACLLMSQPGADGFAVHGDPGDVEPERAAAEAARPGITDRRGDDGRWRTSFPLATDAETVVGLLVVVTSSPVGDNDRNVLTTLANNAAIALEHARLLEQEQEAVRRLRAADRTRTEFLRTTHHELRTPLTVVLGMTDVAERSWDAVGDDQRREFMTTIATGARQLASTIESILTVTTLSADEVPLQRQPIVLRELATACLADAVHRRSLEGARRADVDIPPDLVVDADPIRFRQMLGALVDNALKFTRPDGMVLLRAREIDGDVVLQVVDDGAGIPEDAQRRVFDQFYQAESGHVREFGGLGLGLAIATRICALHKARIELTSTEGEGTQVVVRWPSGRRLEHSVDPMVVAGRS